MILYVVLGILSDAICAGYYLCVSRGQALPASVLSLLIALLNFFVLSRVMVTEPSVVNAVAYAVGNGLGTILIMKIGKRKGP